MKSNTLGLFFLPFVLTMYCSQSYAQNVNLPYQNPALSIEKRIHDLLSRMTLEEKIGQMTQFSNRQVLTGPIKDKNDGFIREALKKGKVGSLLNVVSAEQTRAAQEMNMDNSRLPIPLIFGFDVVHGHQTMFPIPLGMSCSWEPEVIALSARVAAREAAAQGINWTFAPMLDVSRDPRWGRVMEGSGEDPYLTSRMAEAYIRGFQGDLNQANTIAACAKHFAGYGFAEGGRDYNTVDISDHTLHNIVLPSFKAASKAGVATFMNSFNEIGGLPATADYYLQTTLLKEEWGFDGFIVSDWNSIGEMVDHGFAKNIKEASAKAVNAGNDMDMMTYGYISHLKDLVEEGVVDIQIIDEAVSRILRIKFRLGLFEDPYRYCDPEIEKRELGSNENLAAARNVARKSIVLLKNESNILPIKQHVKSIAVIGQLAIDKDTPLGNWRAKAISNSAVSVLEGLEAAFGDQTKIEYARGVEFTKEAGRFNSYPSINTNSTEGLEEAAALARKSELVIVVLGENCFQSGESKSRADIGLPGLQQQMLEELYMVNSNMIVVLMNGRPLDLTWMTERVPAILETWFAGSQSGNAIADVLTGKYNPSGKLTMSFPGTVGQIPVFYNHKSSGRPYKQGGTGFMTAYRDLPNEPLYPFGFGLSYTTFEYSNLEISKAEISKGESLEIKVIITNNGQYDGEEVVQLYIQDPIASRTRPVQELKGFQKVFLKAGDKKKITFELSEKDLLFYNSQKKWIAETGTFKVMIGGNSREVQEVIFELK